VSVRPDLSYAVSVLSQYNNDPTERAWNGLINLFGYISQTRNFGLSYTRNNLSKTTVFTDSDHNSDQDLISRIAYIGQVFGNTVSWKSQKLTNTISMSSCESEFYAAELGGSNGMYLRRLEFALRTGHRPQSEDQMEPCKILMDNQAAIRVLEQDGFNNRTKHIAVRYLWVKTEVRNGRLTPHYISTHMNIADALTKPLKRQHLLTLCTLAGMRSINGGECDERMEISTLTDTKCMYSKRSEFKILSAVQQVQDQNLKKVLLSLVN